MSGIWFCEKKAILHTGTVGTWEATATGRAPSHPVGWWLTEAHGIEAPKNETNGGPRWQWQWQYRLKRH